jgi:hypothetical protein
MMTLLLKFGLPHQSLGATNIYGNLVVGTFVIDVIILNEKSKFSLMILAVPSIYGLLVTKNQYHDAFQRGLQSSHHN